MRKASESWLGHHCYHTATEESGSPLISFAVGNAHDQVFLDCLLDSKWDAIVDFMVWSTAEFSERYKKLLSAAEQYVFTSSYRVYADSSVITEESPRLLDAVDDDEYLATDEYALSKARCENLLWLSPAVTGQLFALR